jgi:hypothetical protein
LLLGVLLTATASVRADQKEGCAPQSASDLADWRKLMSLFDAKALADARAKEADRIGDSSNVLRLEDRLFLALSSGRLATLTDCRFGDALQIHLYEMFDTRGGLYVVATHEYEDFAYTLVTKSSGKKFRTLSRPLWSPDAKRFAHGRCDMLNGYNFVQLVNLATSGELQIAATVDLPCEGRNCDFSWENATSLSVVCRSAVHPAVTDANFKAVLEDGAWKVVR